MFISGEEGDRGDCERYVAIQDRRLGSSDLPTLLLILGVIHSAGTMCWVDTL
jgi:hypothetical protein